MHFNSGVTNIQMIMEKANEKDLPNGGHFVECTKSCFIYWCNNDCQVRLRIFERWIRLMRSVQLVTTGSLRAQFDSNSKIDLLDIETRKHTEYVPRNKLQLPPESPDQKPSPSITKNSKARSSQQRGKLQVPFDQTPQVVAPPQSIINDWGTTVDVSQFLEVWTDNVSLSHTRENFMAHHLLVR